jgi:hypothetical protein
VEASTTRGTTALVYLQLHSSLYTGAVQAEVDKVTLKINGDEALSDESV